MIAEAAAERDTDWTRALVVVTAATIIRIAFAGLLPIFPDEAYYWEWSRRLAPGYFDHPPMVALLIRLGTAIVGATPVGVRVGSILAGLVASIATAAMARRLVGSAAALRAAIVMSVLPLAAAGLVLATPDAALLATSALTLYCVVRAVESSPRSTASLRWWVAAGVALGASFASKYTAILLPLGVLVAIASRPSLRARLREAGPYVACAIATLVFLPVLAWNARHGWISFAFQLKHGLSAPQGSAVVAAWKHEGDLFGGQAGLASPILFVMMGIAVWRSLGRAASDAERVLSVVATVCFGFFAYSALRQRVEANWPSPAYVPAIVLLSIRPRSHASDGWLRAGIGLAAGMSLVIYAQGITPILRLSPARDPVARAFGWGEAVRVVDSTARTLRAGSGATTWIGGDRYQEAAELAFLSPGRPTTFATNLSGRANQYDIWPRFPDVARAGDALVLVVDESAEPHAAIARLTPYFTTIERGALVSLRRGRREIGQRRVWTLLGWRGGWPASN